MVDVNKIVISHESRVDEEGPKDSRAIRKERSLRKSGKPGGFPACFGGLAPGKNDGCAVSSAAAGMSGSRCPSTGSDPFRGTVETCSVHSVLKGKGEGGSHYLSFTFESAGRGPMAVEILEENGKAFLKVTVLNDDASTWLRDKEHAMASVLEESGITLSGFAVECNTKEKFNGGVAESAAGSMDSSEQEKSVSPGASHCPNIRRADDLVG